MVATVTGKEAMSADWIGYPYGMGGTVTQATSRTTAVTLDKLAGQITLFTAAGSATAASFTVNNAKVGADDIVLVSVKSGTNTYQAYVSAVADGSFQITFAAAVGTASDAPVFSFMVFKNDIN